jgi:hypothetical protein
VAIATGPAANIGQATSGDNRTTYGGCDFDAIDAVNPQ